MTNEERLKAINNGISLQEIQEIESEPIEINKEVNNYKRGDLLEVIRSFYKDDILVYKGLKCKYIGKQREGFSNPYNVDFEVNSKIGRLWVFNREDMNNFRKIGWHGEQRENRCYNG